MAISYFLSNTEGVIWLMLPGGLLEGIAGRRETSQLELPDWPFGKLSANVPIAFLFQADTSLSDLPYHGLKHSSGRWYGDLLNLYILAYTAQLPFFGTMVEVASISGIIGLPWRWRNP